MTSRFELCRDKFGLFLDFEGPRATLPIDIQAATKGLKTLLYAGYGTLKNSECVGRLRDRMASVSAEQCPLALTSRFLHTCCILTGLSSNDEREEVAGSSSSSADLGWPLRPQASSLLISLTVDQTGMVSDTAVLLNTTSLIIDDSSNHTVEVPPSLLKHNMYHSKTCCFVAEPSLTPDSR